MFKHLCLYAFICTESQFAWRSGSRSAWSSWSRTESYLCWPVSILGVLLLWTDALKRTLTFVSLYNLSDDRLKIFLYCPVYTPENRKVAQFSMKHNVITEQCVDLTKGCCVEIFWSMFGKLPQKHLKNWNRMGFWKCGSLFSVIISYKSSLVDWLWA